ncbi:AAA family ATPase [Chthonobacter rhizosphaerae]|uniref:AAA family ATPase n=1 Tax=Chthonobacter rhizosphaerae TaxID=2735553 RepID=UPI0015EE6BEE|nr:AAA family ATPase [Chthonobacter rhizosphaerae]
MDGATAKAAQADVHGRIAALLRSLEGGLVGRTPLLERLLVALLAGGHVLVEGAPGLAKTRAVKTLASHLDASFARIQCTSDLMPADLTGTPVWRPDAGSFEFVAGPLFHGLVLVDEINRAPPKVQSALLEAMAERQVTAGGVTHPLPDPFMVVATQNPIEHEGTFPLPEAQLDRFFFHVTVDFPDRAAERAILDLVERETVEPQAAPVARLSVDEIHAARDAAMRTHLAPALKDFIVRLVMATRDGTADTGTAPVVEHPVSPRGTLSLALAVKARAWLAGRDHGTPDDVRALAVDCLSHRLVLTWRATAEGETPRKVIERLFDRVVPL